MHLYFFQPLLLLLLLQRNGSYSCTLDNAHGSKYGGHNASPGYPGLGDGTLERADAGTEGGRLCADMSGRRSLSESIEDENQEEAIGRSEDQGLCGVAGTAVCR